MITTFQALAVAMVALLPGASYTFAYERVVGNYGISFGDRLVRFLASSAIFASVFSGPGYLIYRNAIVSGQLSRGTVSWVVFWAVSLAYVALPTVVGVFLGHGQVSKWRWVLKLVGESPEPRAWDYLWGLRTDGLVRVKLKSGSWLGGIFGNMGHGASYASAYPEKEDLYLSTQLQVDSEDGTFLLDANGLVQPFVGSPGLLLVGEQIDYLVFQEITETP